MNDKIIFPSKISNTLGSQLGRHFFLGVIFFILLKYMLDIDFFQINIVFYITAFVAYVLLTYVYLGRTNNDFILYEDRIEVINNIPLFKKKHTFYYTDIKQALFRHEWTEELKWKFKPAIINFIFNDMIIQSMFPPDYKWIKIDADRIYKFYCFGLEFDYYDNEGPLIEELFHKLGAHGVDVRWTNVELNYYAGMMKTLDEKKKGRIAK